RVDGAGEDDEKAIRRRVDLATGPLLKGGTKQAVVLDQYRGIVVPQLLKQSSAAFDIGEEEGHRARGQRGHGVHSPPSMLLLVEPAGFPLKRNRASPADSAEQFDVRHADFVPSPRGRRQPELWVVRT